MTKTTTVTDPTPIVPSVIVTPHRERMPWQRLTLSLMGIFIVAGMWHWATYHLYALPQPSLSAFTSITTNCFYVIGAIVIFMVSGKLIYDWKNATTSAVIQQASTAVEKLEETYTERNVRPKDVDMNDNE